MRVALALLALVGCGEDLHSLQEDCSSEWPAKGGFTLQCEPPCAERKLALGIPVIDDYDDIVSTPRVCDAPYESVHAGTPVPDGFCTESSVFEWDGVRGCCAFYEEGQFAVAQFIECQE